MEDILDQIYEKLDDAQYYGKYIAAKCVFHDDSRPSLMIYEDRYRCLGCGASGKTESLLKKLSGNGFVPVINVSKNFYNPFTKWGKFKPLAQVLYSAHLTLKNNPLFGTYLCNRGISKQTQINLGIGYRDDWFTFPIWNRDKNIAGAVARKNETNKSTSKYIIPSGQDSNLLYVPDWRIVNERGIVFLTFGILDAISIYQCGYAAMSTTTGKRLDSSILDSFRKRIIVFPDRGEITEALEIVSELGWRGKVYSCDYPEDAKDPNDLFVSHKEALTDQLKRIVSSL